MSIDWIKRIEIEMRASKREGVVGECPNSGQNTNHCHFCGHSHRRRPYKTHTREPGKAVGDVIDDGFRMMGLMD
jgi:hypothetical protein